MAQINANPGFAGRIIASLDPAVIAELARRTSVGFPRLEAEMPDDTVDLKSQAQDIGLWVDCVNRSRQAITASTPVLASSRAGDGNEGKPPG